MTVTASTHRDGPGQTQADNGDRPNSAAPDRATPVEGLNHGVPRRAGRGHDGCPAEVRALPGKLLAGTVARLRNGWQRLLNRYGPRYTRVILAVVFATLLVPLPGAALLSAALVVAVAEVHRAISRRGGLARGAARAIQVMNANLPRWAPGSRPAPPC